MIASKNEKHLIRQYWFQKHPGLTLSFAALFGCLTLLIGLEFMVRIIFPGWTPANEERVKFWQYDSLLGWAGTPNVEGRFNHPDFSVHVSINSQGMRSREYPLERTTKKRILILGDSFGWGFGLEQKDRFSDILERLHPDWEIINASVTGYSTDQEFLLLKARAIQFKPDVILLLFHPNDFEGNTLSEDYWYFKPFFSINNGTLKLQNTPVPMETFKQSCDRFFLGRTFIGPKLYLIITLLQKPFSQKPEKESMQDGTVSDNVYLITYHLLEAINELCKNNGSQFMLASVPTDSIHYKEFLRNAADKIKIPYLPLDSHFASAERSTTRFRHDAHWNNIGNAIAAQALNDFLLKQDVLKNQNQKN